MILLTDTNIIISAFLYVVNLYAGLQPSLFTGNQLLLLFFPIYRKSIIIIIIIII
jgi:hypothetical protein